VRWSRASWGVQRPFDDGRRSPKALLRAVVARPLGRKGPESGGGAMAAPTLSASSSPKD
jgi:hypothetical protein